MNIQLREQAFDIAPFFKGGEPPAPSEDARYAIRHMLLQPDEDIAPHFHLHRSEHWIVVSGSGRVTIGANSFDLFEGQATDIPIGAAHTIYNHGKVPLHIIEVQMGLCLGDTDREPPLI